MPNVNDFDLDDASIKLIASQDALLQIDIAEDQMKRSVLSGGLTPEVATVAREGFNKAREAIITEATGTAPKTMTELAATGTEGEAEGVEGE